MISEHFKMTYSSTSVEPIRHAIESDAFEIARLVTLLGHHSSELDVMKLWPQWTASGNTALVAPGENGKLAGVATLSQMVVLHRPKPVGRISTLVVDLPKRGNGIGQALVLAAEVILKRAGCGILEITSNERLVGAHQFYQHLGYDRTSIRLAKNLSK